MAVPRIALACAGPDDVRVGRGHGHGADAQDVLIVKEGLPVRTAGGAPPQTATRRSGIDDVAVGRVHIEGRHAAAHGAGADVANRVILKQGLGVSDQSEQAEHKKKECRTRKERRHHEGKIPRCPAVCRGCGTGRPQGADDCHRARCTGSIPSALDPDMFALSTNNNTHKISTS